MIESGKSYKVRIKVGTVIGHDYAIGKWPACKPPESEYSGEEWQDETKYPDAIFTGIYTGYWSCERDGYGVLENGEYGNGKITVFDKYGVEIVR